MSDALFVFTIAGVQQFIGESRKLSDLLAGSTLLSSLAGAAARAMSGAGARLIYPADLSGETPNKLMAWIPTGQERQVASAAIAAVDATWRARAEKARRELSRLGPSQDRVWEEIWERQLATQWETYWAAVPIPSGDYQAAFTTVNKALEAAKRTRAFGQVEEDGLKDTLGGARSALRTAAFKDARGYWAEVARAASPSALRPDGRERLDAAGAVKRFGGLAEGIPSVSTIAAASFLDRATREAAPALREYRLLVEKLLGNKLYEVSKNPEWRYDGDLLFRETLEPSRLRISYRVEDLPETERRQADLLLRRLYREVGGRPSPYYAIILLDGDSMGTLVAGCETPWAHRELSELIAAFDREVQATVSRHTGARLVYAGGDDVLALAPASTAIPLAAGLARGFHDKVGATASAGIAFAHHLHPLGSVLAAARSGEASAKEMDGKNAVGVYALKRSGETLRLRSSWPPVDAYWTLVVELLAGGVLSSVFPYHVRQLADLLNPPSDPPDPERSARMREPFASDLRRLTRRHTSPQGNPLEIHGRLVDWMSQLPDGPADLAGWLLLARFVAKGGEE